MRSLKAEITECQAAVRSQRGKNNCREQEWFQVCWGGSAEVAELDLLIHKPLGSGGIPLGSPSAGTCTLSSSSSICPGAGKLKRMGFFGFFFCTKARQTAHFVVPQLIFLQLLWELGSSEMLWD